MIYSKNNYVKKNKIKNFIFLISITLFIIFNVPSSALTSELKDPYMVENIFVDISSSSTIVARDLAINKAQREAYNELINRLVILDNLNYIPRISDNKLTEMISSIQIDKEKALDKRYFGTFLILFNSSKIRNFLRENNISFAEAISKRQMVIPVYEKQGVKMLWDEPNDWMKAWENNPNKNKIFPIFLPEGSLPDIATINANQAIDGNKKSLNKILKRYNLLNGIIIHAVLHQDLNADLLRLHVTVKKFGQQRKNITIQTYTSTTKNSEKKLLQKAVSSVLENLVEDWKLENIIHFNEPNMINVNMPTKDIFYWRKINDLVKGIEIVKRIELLKINKKSTQIIIHFYGSKDQLISSLSRSNIILSNKDNYWEIYLDD